MILNKTSKKKANKATIAGTIIPIEKNKNSSLNRISIRTADGKEYSVDYSGLGKELVNFIHKKVEINGAIKERLDGRKIVIINSYKILEENNEEEVVCT
ncbi:MAG TPA: hypothetical protein VMW42_11915 [Desulfatiglandales bacterium]|nr:hypothetical protein [Desulfatiglandales bacterium]